MKVLPITFLFWFINNCLAVSTELSGNLEAQYRHSWNNEQAKDFPLLQDWQKADFQLIYGNLNGKAEFNNSRLEANWFVRHSQSQLYRDNYLAPRIYTFPNRLVSRDIFQLQHRNEGDQYVTESVLNKFYYELAFEEHRFTLGRMYVNYGLGEIFNPINPFNQPTGLTAISQVAQGSDGLNFTFFISDKYILNFYFLGDKSIEGYDGVIDRTLWAHGEYQATDNLQLDYVVGEDQNRHKLGGQVKYNFSEAMVFIQGLYQSAYTNRQNIPSHNLMDIMIGYDQRLTHLWHLRFEGGYQKENRFADLRNINERFLPTEYFAALSNQLEVHPLVKLNGTFIYDLKTSFGYFINRNTFDLGKSTEFEIFAYLPVSKGVDSNNLAQRIVTTDIGAALRTFF
jgi:hypothetical protein